MSKKKADIQFNTAAEVNELPVMALRDGILLPGMQSVFHIGREETVNAVQEAMARHNGKLIFLAQKNTEQETLSLDNLHDVGVIVQIDDYEKEADGTVSIAVTATDRVAIDALALENGFLSAQNTIKDYNDISSAETSAAFSLAKESFVKSLAVAGKIDSSVLEAISSTQLDEHQNFIALMFTHLNNSNSDEITVLPENDKQALLENDSLAEVFETLYEHLEKIGLLHKTEKKIKARTKSQMEKNQRDYFLKEQMKAIREELGEGDDAETDEIDELASHFENETIPEHVRQRATKELNRLRKMSPMQAEYNIIRGYLDVLRDIPWGVKSDTNDDLQQARKDLDQDHFGLDDVKDNVIKHLAVQKRLKAKGIEDVAEAKIMCMVGPPGVGKTSIAQSLAKSTSRQYVRLALGGVRDESEIRGHRRTYIGAKPGKIVSHLIKAGTMNPLFVLDEIDKMGSDQRGDPASAMLEVLDPEQNKAFEDHYVDLEIDLSDIMFYCTANEFSRIPGPLSDRMEVTFLGSYMPDEKLQIAKQHLVRKQMRSSGLDENEFSITDGALQKIISAYTRESGVRNLRRIIGKVCIEAVMKLEEEGIASVHVTEDMLEDLLGPEQVREYSTLKEDTVGVVAGLYYSSIGGGPLFIQSLKLPGENAKIEVTGNVEKVMQESVTYAHKYLRAYADQIGLSEDDKNTLNASELHIHCPEAATPKDGPSAGAAMLTAIYSQVTNKPVNRLVAMTGEIDMMGNVTAIGGVKEKLTGAAMAGFKTVLIPEANIRNLHEVPQQVLDELEVIPVSNVRQVLEHAIVGYKAPKIS